MPYDAGRLVVGCGNVLFKDDGFGPVCDLHETSLQIIVVYSILYFSCNGVRRKNKNTV